MYFINATLELSMCKISSNRLKNLQEYIVIFIEYYNININIKKPKNK